MIINGKKIAQRILEEVKEKLQKSEKKLWLAAVLVGQNLELKKFVELKKKAAEEIGIEFRTYEFPENVTENQLEKELNEIAEDETVNGIIIELPLPKHLNTQCLLNTIPEKKDIDVLSKKSQDAFFAGKSKILPPAVEAVKQIFEEYKINPKGKTAAIFGYGLLVGELVSHWLVNQGATVSIITEHVKEPEKISKETDIIVSGVGKQNLITEDMIKDGAIIIDFGKDADFESISQKTSLITPPVGGVGPIVVASVLKNLIELWI